MIRDMEELGPIVQTNSQKVVMAPRVEKAALMQEFVAEIRPVGERIERIGRALENLVIEMSRLVSNYQSLIESHGTEEMQSGFEKELVDLRSQFGVLEMVSNVLDEFLDALTP